MGMIIKTLWDEIKSVQALNAKLTDKLAQVEILVVGKYVTAEILDRMINAIFSKLDKIESKVDGNFGDRDR